MDKGVPIKASGDTPLPVTEIVHENPHASGASDMSSKESTPSRRVKAREAAARMERMEKAQGEMRAAQEKLSTQQGEMSSQMGKLLE